MTKKQDTTLKLALRIVGAVYCVAISGLALWNLFAGVAPQPLRDVFNVLCLMVALVGIVTKRPYLLAGAGAFAIVFVVESTIRFHGSPLPSAIFVGFVFPIVLFVAIYMSFARKTLSHPASHG